MNLSRKGFTLTELLIVVAIVAILAAIALPRYLQGEAARASEAISQISAIRLGEENYKTNQGHYYPCPSTTPPDPKPNCWTTIGTDDPQASLQRYFDYNAFTNNPTNSQFCIAATRRDYPPGNPNNGQTICLDNQGQYFGTHPNSPGFGNPTGTGPCSSLPPSLSAC